LGKAVAPKSVGADSALAEAMKARTKRLAPIIGKAAQPNHFPDKDGVAVMSAEAGGSWWGYDPIIMLSW
jgi:hypothetical protein